MTPFIARTLLVSGAAAGLLAGVTACSCSVGSSHTVSKSDVAGQITSKMTDAAGNKPDSVNCPNDLPAKVGAQLNCEMKVKNQTFNVNDRDQRRRKGRQVRHGGDGRQGPGRQDHQ
jgi:hypothetical protein